jgi:hypothetical protein
MEFTALFLGLTVVLLVASLGPRSLIFGLLALVEELSTASKAEINSNFRRAKDMMQLFG